MIGEEKKENFIYDEYDLHTENRRMRKSLFPSPTRFPRRRANSEPGSLGSDGQGRLLVEDHYRIEEDTKILLPGVPSQDDDWARDTHDFFNLVVLLPIIVLNVMNWNWEQLLSSKRKKTIESAWTGDYFIQFWKITMLYFVVDLLWVCIIPRCVKSPTTIIQHHIVTIIYIMVPLLHPEYQWCMGACLSVEVNTWFLIARRVLNKVGLSPWTIDLPFLVSIRVKLISIFFYITWVTIRCIFFPMLTIRFYDIWVKHSARHGTNFHLISLVLPIQSIFCLLNAKWTYDLFMSKIRQIRSKKKDKDSKYL